MANSEAVEMKTSTKFFKSSRSAVGRFSVAKELNGVKMNPSSKMDNKNQCVICFNQFKINNTPPNVSQKMYKLCRKYLHSEIMKETLASKWDLSTENSLLLFCSNCFESAVELNDLTEQLEFLQKSISELILMFSMGILHRRSKTPNPNRKTNSGESISKKLVEVDCSGLTECNSWNGSTPLSRASIKEPYLELAVNCMSDSKSQEYDDPLYGIDEDDNYIEIKQEDHMDEEDDEVAVNPIKSPVYFPSAAYFTTESDPKTPAVIHIEDVPAPMQKTIVINAGTSSQTLVIAETAPVEPTKHRRKTKLIPLNEVVEEEEESNSSSNAESTAEKTSKRLYHLDPRSVQPGRDRRRVQKALNCYKYRLKKKQEAEQTIGRLNSDINNLKMQLQMLKQQNGQNGSTPHKTARR